MRHYNNLIYVVFGTTQDAVLTTSVVINNTISLLHVFTLQIPYPHHLHECYMRLHL